jgi:hypothetical protein
MKAVTSETAKRCRDIMTCLKARTKSYGVIREIIGRVKARHRHEGERRA